MQHSINLSQNKTGERFNLCNVYGSNVESKANMMMAGPTDPQTLFLFVDGVVGVCWFEQSWHRITLV